MVASGLLAPIGLALATPQLLVPPAIATPLTSTKIEYAPSSPFSLEEMRTFAAAVAKADKLKDPLQRCLHFPGPPGSHWSREGVVAYCNYMFQPMMNFADFRRLVTSGQAKEVDRRLAKLTEDPATHPEMFWHFLMENFNEADPAKLALVESWKQQSPSSAFAHTAAGLQYVMAGWHARGKKFASDTPDQNMESMSTQVARAVGDLERANRLDSKLSATYAVMVEAGTLTGDPAYAAEAAKRGLTAEPGAFPIISALVVFVSDRWYGNQALQTWLLGQAKHAATRQPLLLTIESSVLSEQARIDYQPPTEPLTWAFYRKAFDQVSNFTTLKRAGDTALRNDQYDVAYVYLSEASRYDATDDEVKDGRNRSLSIIGSSIEAH
jgi:hypothetical protein